MSNTGAEEQDGWEMFKQLVVRNEEFKRETERKNAKRPKTNGKGKTKRNQVLPIRMEADFKELLKLISEKLETDNRRFKTMSDVITVAVKEYAINNYPDIYNAIYKQSSI